MAEVNWHKDPTVLIKHWTRIAPSKEMDHTAKHNSFIRMVFAVSFLLMVAFRSWKPLLLPIVAMTISLITKERYKFVVVSQNGEVIHAGNEIPENINGAIGVETDGQNEQINGVDIPEPPAIETPESPETIANVHRGEYTLPLPTPEGPPKLYPLPTRPAPVTSHTNRLPEPESRNETYIAEPMNSAPSPGHVILPEVVAEGPKYQLKDPVRKGIPRSHRRTFCNRSRQAQKGSSQSRFGSGVSPAVRPLQNTQHTVREAQIAPREALMQQLLKMKENGTRKDFTPGPEQISDRAAFVKFWQQPTGLEPPRELRHA